MNYRIATLVDKRQPLFLTDGGLETTLVFHEGWELPEFAGFTLLDSASGRSTLESKERVQAIFTPNNEPNTEEGQ